MPHWRDSSTWRIFRYTLACLLLLVLGCSAAFVAVLSQREHGDLENLLENIDATQIPALVAVLWVTNHAEVRRILGGLTGYRQIDGARIREADGEVFTAGEIDAPGQSGVTRELVYTHGPTAIPIGTLELFVADRQMRRAVLRSGATMLLSGLGAALLLAGAMAGIFCLTIGRHLSRFARFIETDDPARDRTGLTLRRRATIRDELAVLVGHYNAMRRRISSTVTALREATARAEAGEALLARAEQLAQVGSWTEDRKADQMTWSDELYRILGSSQGTTPAPQRLLEAVHPEDRPAVERADAASRREAREGYDLEHRIIRQDSGAVRFVHQRCVHERDACGDVVRSVGMIQDVTRRKQAQAALRESNQRLAAFVKVSRSLTTTFETAPVMQMLVDNAVGVMDLDSGAIYLLEGQALYLAATTPPLPDDFPERHRRAEAGDHPHIQEALNTARPVVLPDTAAALLSPAERDIVAARHLCSNLYLPILFRERPIGVLILAACHAPRAFQEEEITLLQGFADQAGQIIDNARRYEESLRQATDLAREVGQRRRAEEALRRLNLELEERVRQRTREMEEANRQLEAFSSSVSHDLRAPLRGLGGLSRKLLDRHAQDLSEDGQRLCVRIQDAARNMGRMIDSLLAFSRSGRKTLKTADVDMTALVREVVDELRADTAAARVDFQVDGLPPATADAALIRQVWRNLLENAATFASREEQPVVQVSALRQEGQSAYQVRDNGVGFDMRDAHKLFGVFQRLRFARDLEGAGVGLAIVHQIVTRHGGRIQAQGEPGRGATFSFTLGSGRDA